MQLLKYHSWRSACIKAEGNKLLRSFFSATWICCNVVFRHWAKISSGISNLWCHITLSQTLNQPLSLHTEIQMRILISQPDKKIEMLMIYWRQEVYGHRWTAAAQTHPGALTADGKGTQSPPAHPAVPGSKLLQQHSQSMAREGRKWGSVEAKPGNCTLAISQPEAVNHP